MSVRMKLEISGTKDLLRYLENKLPEAFNNSISEVLKEAAQVGKERAQSLVPVDTGALRKSIRIERLGMKSGKITYTGIRAGGYIRNPKTNKIVDYAAHVEYGTSRQAPQPYMRPAAEYAMQRVPGLFWNHLYRRVDK